MGDIIGTKVYVLTKIDMDDDDTKPFVCLDINTALEILKEEIEEYLQEWDLSDDEVTFYEYDGKLEMVASCNNSVWYIKETEIN